MNNYKILRWLVKDGGYYTRAEHIALLKKAFPEWEITAKNINNLRSSMTRSTLIKSHVIYDKGVSTRIKVISVSPQFSKYSHVRTKKSDSTPFTFLKNEPPETIRRIELYMMFNKLSLIHRNQQHMTSDSTPPFVQIK